MSIKRDVNGYMIIDIPAGGQLLWAGEDRVLFARPNEDCTPLTTDPNDHFEDVLEALEHSLNEQERLAGRMEQSHRDAVHARVKQEEAEEERDRAIQELRDYKAKRGENLGEMLDARAEVDRLRKKLQDSQVKCDSLMHVVKEVSELLTWKYRNREVAREDAVKVIYSWLKDNKPAAFQEEKDRSR
ncbi:hypothetical protein [Paenibacillus tundrae]|uniref:hypothetical protein n=1 Tax=Paenibacillus tundrae TaxID=528187 RepID=UPI0022A8DDAB|nr:hypothetical protein [Paenibacillus tundrae]MCZ1265391.1 hypothetical protein [Paenibacillus tundrae]